MSWKGTSTQSRDRCTRRNRASHRAVKARVTIFVILTSLAAVLAPVAEAAGRWG